MGIIIKVRYNVMIFQHYQNTYNSKNTLPNNTFTFTAMLKKSQVSGNDIIMSDILYLLTDCPFNIHGYVQFLLKYCHLNQILHI